MQGTARGCGGGTTLLPPVAFGPLVVPAGAQFAASSFPSAPGCTQPVFFCPSPREIPPLLFSNWGSAGDSFLGIRPGAALRAAGGRAAENCTIAMPASVEPTNREATTKTDAAVLKSQMRCSSL